MRTVAALFVDPRGCYADLDGVELWDERRDARLYAGPHPVVGHPPCSRWCRLAGLVEARWGHKKGDDGGCFASCLANVRRVGGVLEHPAYSDAWAAHDLTPPPSGGGSGEERPRVGKREASATPPAFRDEPLAMARTAALRQEVA